MPKNSKAADLLKVLGQRTPTADVLPAKMPAALAAQPLAPRRNTNSRSPKRDAARPKGRGKAIQFHLHAGDERLIREFFRLALAAPDYSLVIKALLRTAKTGPALLAGYDEGLAVSEADRETKRRADNV